MILPRRTDDTSKHAGLIQSAAHVGFGGTRAAGAPGTIRVHVDPDKRQGHNRCYSIAPELFDIDDIGMSSEHGDGIVPPDLEEKARRGAANCPEYAITITEIASEQA